MPAYEFNFKTERFHVCKASTNRGIRWEVQDRQQNDSVVDRFHTDVEAFAYAAYLNLTHY